MTPTLEEQRRRWQAFTAQVAELARDQGIEGIALAGLIRYQDPLGGGTTVLAYAGLSPGLRWQMTPNVRGAVVTGIGDHYDRAVALLDKP